MISDTSLAPFAPPRRVRQIVDVVAGTTAQLAPLPMSAAEIAADACKERKRPATHPIVVGQVQVPSDVTTAALSLGVQWGANGVDDPITKIDIDTRGRFLDAGTFASPRPRAKRSSSTFAALALHPRCIRSAKEPIQLSTSCCCRWHNSSTQSK
jgi:hypothetical protein